MLLFSYKAFRLQYEVIEFQTATQKNEAKLISFLQFESEMGSYNTL